MLDRDSYPFLSIRLSYKLLLWNLLKEVIVCWSFWYRSLYLLYLFVIILCSTLLPSDRVHAIPADIGHVKWLIPKVDRLIEVDVAPIKPIVSTDANIGYDKRNFNYL